MTTPMTLQRRYGQDGVWADLPATQDAKERAVLENYPTGSIFSFTRKDGLGPAVQWRLVPAKPRLQRRNTCGWLCPDQWQNQAMSDSRHRRAHDLLTANPDIQEVTINGLNYRLVR